MIGCEAEGLSAATDITAPQQPSKHTPPEERWPASSVVLKSLLQYTYLNTVFWVCPTERIFKTPDKVYGISLMFLWFFCLGKPAQNYETSSFSHSYIHF